MVKTALEWSFERRDHSLAFSGVEGAQTLVGDSTSVSVLCAREVSSNENFRFNETSCWRMWGVSYPMPNKKSSHIFLKTALSGTWVDSHEDGGPLPES